jgi:uncharacterized protein (TIGR03083 family)
VANATRTAARLPFERYHAELRAETARFAAAVAAADPALPVPTCPGWTLAQLAAHVGHGMRWPAVIVERRATGPVPNEQADDLEVPDGAEARSAWLAAGARRLSDAVRRLGPETGVWSWADDRTAGFWLRRVTHDTLVHRLDAELAVGRDPRVAADLAADGVADLLDMFTVLPRVDDFPELDALRGDGEALHFHATDQGLGAAGEWLARRSPAGVAWEQRHGPADVTVRGPAAELLLLLTRRAALGDRPGVEVAGDRRLLAHWLDHSRF